MLLTPQKKSLVDIKTVLSYLTWIILISIHAQRLAGMLYWVSRTTCSEYDCGAVKMQNSKVSSGPVQGGDGVQTNNVARFNYSLSWFSNILLAEAVLLVN